MSKTTNKNQFISFGTLEKILSFIILHPFIFLFTIVIATIFYYFLKFFGGKTEYQKFVEKCIEETKTFKGFKRPKKWSSYHESDNAENQTEGSDGVDNLSTIDNEKLHFIIYGKTASGKTSFLKKYIEKNYPNKSNVYIFCKNENEWQSYPKVLNENHLDNLKEMESFKGTSSQKNFLVLDDMGGLMNQKDVAEYYTKARHLNIVICTLVHKPCDVENKIRMNIDSLYITTQNSDLFFSDLKKNYKIKEPLEKYKSIPYGMIKFNTATDNYKVYDQYLNVVADSEQNFEVTKPNFKITKFISNRELTKEETEQIIEFLEGESIEQITIVPETLYFYLDYYLNKVLKIRTPKRLPRQKNLESYFKEIRKQYDTMEPMIKGLFGFFR